MDRWTDSVLRHGFGAHTHDTVQSVCVTHALLYFMYSTVNQWLTSCKSAELASQWKFERREPGRDGKILSYNRKDGNVALGGIGNLAR